MKTENGSVLVVVHRMIEDKVLQLVYTELGYEFLR